MQLHRNPVSTYRSLQTLTFLKENCRGIGVEIKVLVHLDFEELRILGRGKLETGKELQFFVVIEIN